MLKNKKNYTDIHIIENITMLYNLYEYMNMITCVVNVAK